MYRFAFLFLILVSSCSRGKATHYTGSTPATSTVVRQFLDIPLTDSVDFIRWNLQVDKNIFFLNCQFGIGKPNTSGFMNDGKTIRFEGNIRKVKNQYQLSYGSRSIILVELNTDILHFLDEYNRMMVGNAGWSYTLNNRKPTGTGQFSIEPASAVFRDSLVFQGRTPCGIPGLENVGNCYKLKWQIILYPDSEKSGGGTFRLFGTKWRTGEPKRGYWKLVKGKQGRILYSLFENNHGHLFTLLKVGEDVVYFIDENGNPLVGNEDFSYSLNRFN